jgi:hypothetical protein
MLISNLSTIGAGNDADHRLPSEHPSTDCYLGPAQFLQALYERPKAGLPIRIILGYLHEHADATR